MDITSHDGAVHHTLSVEDAGNGAVYLQSVIEGDDEPGSRSCTYIPADVRADLAALLAVPRFDADARQLNLL